MDKDGFFLDTTIMYSKLQCTVNFIRQDCLRSKVAYAQELTVKTLLTEKINVGFGMINNYWIT